MAQQPRKAVVLLSGGIDSAVTAAIAREQGFALFALTLTYGQRHAVEVEAAARVADQLAAADRKVLSVGLRAFGGSALTDRIDVPKSARVEDIGRGIPVTYVPARNTVFLALALAYAEAVGSTDIFIGVNAIDYSGYPDCRPAFIEAFECVANLGTRAGTEGARFEIHAPLVNMTKTEIIREGVRLGIDFSLTHSCYDPAPDGSACGSCDSCLLRKRGLEDAGVEDPTRYKTAPP